MLCLIVTDGEENSSRETSAEQVEAIIRNRERRGDWTFTYLGVEPRRWASIGVAAANLAVYQPGDPRQGFARMSRSAAQFRERAARQSRDFYSQDEA